VRCGIASARGSGKAESFDDTYFWRPRSGARLMPGPLKLPRHEAFVQLVAKGESWTDAFEHAGFVRSSKNAARLAGRADVKARLAELQERAAEKAVISAADICGAARRRSHVRHPTEGAGGCDIGHAGQGKGAGPDHRKAAARIRPHRPVRRRIGAA
jgi:hypothetical protein